MNEQPIGFELVKSYAVVVDDDYEAAGALLADLRVNQKATAALLPVIAWAVSNQRRQFQRTEQQSFRRSARKGLGFTHDAISERKRALDTIMSFGDGRRVRMGQATVEHHREYIAMLERNVNGICETIAFHESLIRMIEQAGVSCLDEVADLGEVAA